MSIVLPFTSFFGVHDLPREVASTVIDTVRGNIRLVRKLSETFTLPFNLSVLFPKKDKQ